MAGAPAAADCSSIGPARGALMSCCPALGVDACSPGSYCAALDGRTVATCYLHSSRTGGQQCTQNELCMSQVCTDGTCAPVSWRALYSRPNLRR